MQRDLQITPRRLEYTREKEGELFSSLMAIANRKQEEMKEMIVETLASMKEQLLEDAANLEFTGQRLKDVRVSDGVCVRLRSGIHCFIQYVVFHV